MNVYLQLLKIRTCLVGGVRSKVVEVVTGNEGNGRTTEDHLWEPRQRNGRTGLQGDKMLEEEGKDYPPRRKIG